MDKLQKLFENNICYKISSYGKNFALDFKIFNSKNRGEEFESEHDSIESGIDWLLEMAKKIKPDAECFKEENQGPPPPPVIVSTGTPLSIGREVV